MRLRELIPLEENLVVAFRHKKTGKLTVGKPGNIHVDLIPRDLSTDKWEKHLNAHDDGFATPEGKFLDRHQAMDYSLKHNLIDKKRTKLSTKKLIKWSGNNLDSLWLKDD